MIKKQIVKNWDEDYAEFGDEVFTIELLETKPTQIERFLTSMWGRISDGSHHLEGEAKAEKINQIQREQKDAVWQMSQGEDVLTKEEHQKKLENILRLIGFIDNAKNIGE